MLNEKHEKVLKSRFEYITIEKDAAHEKRLRWAFKEQMIDLQWFCNQLPENYSVHINKAVSKTDKEYSIASLHLKVEGEEKPIYICGRIYADLNTKLNKYFILFKSLIETLEYSMKNTNDVDKLAEIRTIAKMLPTVAPANFK